jgi:hypothetical protein
MVITIESYRSIGEIAEALNKEIDNTKSALGNYLLKLDETRILAEKTKKIREALLKATGRKNGKIENMGEIAVGDLIIVLDANPFHELSAIEDAVRSYQEHLMVLQKASEELKPFDQLGDTEGLKVTVEMNQGVPVRILFRAY